MHKARLCDKEIYYVEEIGENEDICRHKMSPPSPGIPAYPLSHTVIDPALLRLCD